MRKITYCQAVNEAIMQEMERDESVFVYGIGVADHKTIFGSIDGILDRFGTERCVETPVAEESMLGFGLGAALGGKRPIHIHIRVDFLLLAMNQLVNMVSIHKYMTGRPVPLVVRAVIGRGWGQGAQHSKTLQSFFAHIPGLQVIMPTSPYDAKGMLTTAIRSNNPVVCLEHRWLYWQEGEVPEESYTVDIGTPNKVREGKDLTIVATSWMNVEALKAIEIMKKRGINIELIDVRTISDFDKKMIIESVQKTKKCIVVDNDWSYCGFNAELAAIIYEHCHKSLDQPVKRIGFEHFPCPTTRKLENVFYPNAVDIIRATEQMLGLASTDLSGENFYSHENRFKGPF